MTFNSEAAFEEALISELQNKGWGECEVINRPTEADLLKNWASFLYENNNTRDRLNGEPLTDTEMLQLIEKINELKTPLKLNGFINGKTVSITRDNPADKAHLGKEISLKIYDPYEIAAGQSRYQIVQQPQFAKKSKLLRDRRGDVMLLINGMPVIHIELKRSAVPVSHASHQIENYSAEGVFSGLFALVQIFVAMTPEETLYFSNPGVDGKFNKDFYFNWANFNNEPVNDWKSVTTALLSIPMAHQLIGLYTVADGTDGVLKVMRSYQYYAANAISDKVAKANWADKERLGGYVWHTTGSGKTMTSFKSAQLIADSKNADKVVFLMDRIELGVQSFQEFQGFAGDTATVQATENTGVLISKLKSDDPANTLIVSSIQKMSNISEESGLQSHDVQTINDKRIVFIIDEAHRSTMSGGTECKDGMLVAIKKTFPSAMFFGFTGTPILKENKKNDSTTAMVFGNELHRYSIADGIRDKNVLGFDPYRVMTYKDKDLRKAVALEKARADSVTDALADPKKKAVFNRYMQQVDMAGHTNAQGDYIKGIEDEIPRAQYEREAHKNSVVEDIVDGWHTLSQGNKFHAIFATSSIPEAIEYYRLMKAAKPDLKVTALFDPNIDESANVQEKTRIKQDGLVEILEDYNQAYGQDYSLATHASFKKDVAARLAHKKPYLGIERDREKQIDLLIVVDQMLTGFDSKWLNTLYLDKVLEYANIIQAFSRTNRLFDINEKPFGTIKYYRYPHTMARNIDDAIKLYSGDKPIGLFVDKLESNLKKINATFDEISDLFAQAGVANFEKLPEDSTECGQFAKLFKQFNAYLEAAKIQGFVWDQSTYHFGKAEDKRAISLSLSQNIYWVLVLRYKELSADSGVGGGEQAVAYDLSAHISEMDTGKIDADYMNTRFDKYLKTLHQSGAAGEQIQKDVDELHKSFATLTQEEQKYAKLFLNDVQRGDVDLDEGKTFRDYITEYQSNAKHSQIIEVVNVFGLDDSEFGVKLAKLMSTAVTRSNMNEFGRFDDLKSSVDKAKAKAYFEALEGEPVSVFQVNVKVDKLLTDFIIQGGFDL